MIQAILLGVVSGMRSMLGLAVLSHRLSANASGANLGRLQFLRNPWPARVLKVLAAGELVADKLPFTPNRVEALPLSARIASGALCGAALSLNRGRDRSRAATDAGFGVAGAIAGAVGFYLLRKGVTLAEPRWSLPAALVEDVAALAIGALATRAISAAPDLTPTRPSASSV